MSFSKFSILNNNYHIEQKINYWNQFYLKQNAVEIVKSI